MSNGAIGLLVIFGIIGGLFALVWLDFKICDWVNKLDEAKHRKEHPEFFRLCDEYSEKAYRACDFHNKTIAPYMKKIDDMMKEADYLPQEVINQHEEKIEELRNRLFAAKSIEKGYDNMAKEARKKVVEYIHANNIKWAGNWD